MKDAHGYPTTPKLQSLVQRQTAGEDVVKDLVPYARKGYRAGEEGLIDAAEAGSEQAKAELTSLLLAENHLDTHQLKRAYQVCDMAPESKKDLLIKIANKGEDWALELLKKDYKHPQRFTNLLGGTAEAALMTKMGSKDSHFTHFTISEDLRALERELSAEGDSPLEQLLISRISLSYFALQFFETLYYQNCDKPMNPRTHQLQLQRMQQAHDRYLAAVKSLAQVRKLRIPNLQVNIGDKQINVAGQR